MSQIWEASSHAYAGRIDRFLEISAALAAQTGLAHVGGLLGLTYMLPGLGGPLKPK